MVKKVWLLVILLPAKIILAQESQVDSLERLIRNYTKKDTGRLNLLNELSFACYSVNPGKGIKIATEAIALAEHLNLPSQLASAYNNLGTNYWAQGADSLAMDAREKALALHRQAGNKEGTAKTLNNLALDYYNTADLKKALEYNKRALELFRELNHLNGIAHSYANTGVIYLSLSDYPKALENFLNSLRYGQGADSILRANAMANIGLVYKNMNKFAEALEYNKNALDIYVRAGQKQGEANVLGNLGTLYSEMKGAHAEALRYYRESIALNTEIGNKRRIASDLVNIAVVYQQMNDYPTALGYLQQGLTAYRQTNDKENTSFTLVKLTEAYLDAPHLWKSGNAGRSFEDMMFGYLNEALKLAVESGSLQNQRLAWEALSRGYEKYGYPQKALDAFKKQVTLKDSIYNSEKNKEIARQQIQFEFENKEALLKAGYEKERLLAEAEIRRKEVIQTAMIAGGILLLLAVSTGYFLYKKRKDAEKKRIEAEFKALIADTRMKAFRAQMNPHFIFNSLNAISNFIGAHKLESAEDYLIGFSRLIRMILENSEYNEITLADDLTALELYMQLEAARVEHGFVYQIDVDEEIDPENTLVPPLIFQPFVENSIWHGVSKKKSGGRILIRIKRRADKLVCIVEDNGPGRSNAISEQAFSIKQKKSMGIKLTQSRIDILNDQDGYEADIAYTDMPEGLRVTIGLPLLHKF